MTTTSRGALGLSALCAALLGLAVFASCRLPGSGAGRGAPSQPALDAARANSRCFECHVDFKEEELTLVHQQAGVTCMRCHGHSQAHIDDEVRATPPDATFRGKAMRAFCLTCHDPAMHDAVPAHEANQAVEPAKRRSCTACHGEHELLDIPG